MIDKFKVLESTLKGANKAWGTVYKVIDGNLYCYAKPICRIEDLQKVFLDDDAVILDFEDDNKLFLTAKGYYFESEGKEAVSI